MTTQSPSAEEIKKSAIEALELVYYAKDPEDQRKMADKAANFSMPILLSGTEEEISALVQGIIETVASKIPYYNRKGNHSAFDPALRRMFDVGNFDVWARIIEEGVADISRQKVKMASANPKRPAILEKPVL